MVKSWRYFRRALRMLLSENQRIKCKERTRYIAIDPDLSPETLFFRRSRASSTRSAEKQRNDFSDGFYSSYDSQCFDRNSRRGSDEGQESRERAAFTPFVQDESEEQP